MTRPADDPGNPRKEMVCLRLTKEELEVLDHLRGEQSRAQFVRQLIKRESARQWRAR